MCLSQGIRRKWCKTFTSLLDQPTSLYRVDPHFGQVGSSTYTPQNNTPILTHMD
jgi:hypothetical protein